MAFVIDLKRETGVFSTVSIIDDDIEEDINDSCELLQLLNSCALISIFLLVMND